ncbi:MAG TPA: DMT family transporter [Acidimicrobiales bacterium]
MRRAPAPLLVVAAAVLWGTTGTAQALGPDGAQSVAVGAARVAVGGAALAALVVTRRPRRRAAAPWPPVALGLSAAAVAAYQLLFFAAVRSTGVALGTAVAIGSGPVAAGLLGLVVRGERPDRAWAAGTAFAVAGCALLLAGGGDAEADPAGVALALGAGASYAAYTVGTKGLLDGHGPDEVAAACFGLAGVALVPALLLAGAGWLATAGGLAMVAHLGLVTTAVAYALFFRGLDGVPVATAATLSLTEPLTAGVLGVVVLGERPTAVAVAGAGLLLGGLVLAARPRVPGHAHRDLRGP